MLPLLPLAAGWEDTSLLWGIAFHSPGCLHLPWLLERTLLHLLSNLELM